MEKPTDPIGSNTVKTNNNPRSAQIDDITENRLGDQNFDRYSSEVGFSGTESWTSHTDDTGAGMYAPQDPNAAQKLQGPSRRSMEPRRGLDEPHTDETQD